MVLKGHSLSSYSTFAFGYLVLIRRWTFRAIFAFSSWRSLEMSRLTVKCYCSLNTFIEFFALFCRYVRFGTFVVSRRSGRSGFVGFWYLNFAKLASRFRSLAGSVWSHARPFRSTNGSGFGNDLGRWKSSLVPDFPQSLIFLCTTSPINHALEQNPCQLYPRFPSWRCSCGYSFPPPAFVSATECPSVISLAISNPICSRCRLCTWIMTKDC